MKTRKQKIEEEGTNADRQNTKWSQIVDNCNHNWQPVQFRMEVSGEAPDLNNGRLFCVCMKCCGHTYIETAWIGSYLNSPDILEEDAVTETYAIKITPIGKPRMTRKDRWLDPPRKVVAKYWAFKDELILACNQVGFKLKSKLVATYTIPMPESWTNKKKLKMDGKPHQQTPDIDNINKAVMDALAKQDNYVYSVNCQKYWGRIGEITFTDSVDS